MYYQQYYQTVSQTMEAIFSQETPKIEQAGAMLAETLKKEGLLYVFGCGHSHMLAEELFYRAGGLAPVYPIFETAAMLHEGAAKSSRIERMSGYAKHVMDRYPIGPNDCLLVVSTSGINPFPMEIAEAAKAFLPLLTWAIPPAIKTASTCPTSATSVWTTMCPPAMPPFRSAPTAPRQAPFPPSHPLPLPIPSCFMPAKF